MAARKITPSGTYREVVLDLPTFVKKETKTSKNFIGAHFLEPSISTSHFTSEYYVVIKPVYSCSSCIQGTIPKIVCPITLENLNSPVLKDKSDQRKDSMPKQIEDI